MAGKESKQAQAKREQGWRKLPDACSRCAHFKYDIEQVPIYNSNKTWPKETNIRCGLGGFKTGKSNVCDKFKEVRDGR